MIYLADKKDAKEIAKIHKQEISGGFLSSLPLIFLERVYCSIIKNDFCIISKNENQIIGFVSGTQNIKKLYANFLKDYFFISIIILLPKIINIKKFFETLFYPKKENKFTNAELLTVAVRKDFRGQGIAKKMLEFFILEMEKRNVKKFKVLVGEDLKPAIDFYEKNGFKFFKEIFVHSKKKSRIYIYNL